MLIMVVPDKCLLLITLTIISTLLGATYRLVPRDLLEDDVGLIGLHVGRHVVCPLGCMSGWRAGKVQ